MVTSKKIHAAGEPARPRGKGADDNGSPAAFRPVPAGRRSSRGAAGYGFRTSLRLILSGICWYRKGVSSLARPANEHAVGLAVEVDYLGHPLSLFVSRIMVRASRLYQSTVVLGRPSLSAASWAV